MTSFLSRCCNFCSTIFSHSLDNETLIGTCRVSLDTLYCVLPYIFFYTVQRVYLSSVYTSVARRDCPNVNGEERALHCCRICWLNFGWLTSWTWQWGFVFAFHLAAVRLVFHNWVRRVGWLTYRFLCDCSLESFVTFFSGSYRRWEFDKIIEGGTSCWCVCVCIVNDS